MPALPRRQDRFHICRLLVDLSKDLHAHLYGDTSNFGASVDGLLISACVVFGHAENKPMTAHKIALYLGMPRATVVRKLDELVRIGAIERNNKVYCITKRRQAKTDHLDHAVKLILKHAAEIANNL